MLRAIPIVHAIADASVLSDPEFGRRAAAVFDALGARGAVHLRARDLGRRVYELATTLVAEQARTGCTLVINDRVDIAMACKARAVQLPASGLGIADARRIAPNVQMGASVHSAGDAASAGAERVDWLVAGSVYATPTHASEAPRGVAWIREIARVGPPVIAIGGIVPENVRDVLENGAHGVAAIRGIWGERDPANAARRYLEHALKNAANPR